MAKIIDLVEITDIDSVVDKIWFLTEKNENESTKRANLSTFMNKIIEKVNDFIDEKLKQLTDSQEAVYRRTHVVEPSVDNSNFDKTDNTSKRGRIYLNDLSDENNENYITYNGKSDMFSNSGGSFVMEMVIFYNYVGAPPINERIFSIYKNEFVFVGNNMVIYSDSNYPKNMNIEYRGNNNNYDNNNILINANGNIKKENDVEFDGRGYIGEHYNVINNNNDIILYEKLHHRPESITDNKLYGITFKTVLDAQDKYFEYILPMYDTQEYNDIKYDIRINIKKIN